MITFFQTPACHLGPVFLFFKDHVSKWKPTPIMASKVKTLSELSFGIYLVHVFFIYLMQYIGMTTLVLPVLSVPLIALIVYAVSFLTAWILNKIPVLNKYIL